MKKNIMIFILGLYSALLFAGTPMKIISVLLEKVGLKRLQRKLRLQNLARILDKQLNLKIRLYRLRSSLMFLMKKNSICAVT